VNTVGGPLLALFLLGMLTRRATAFSSLTAMVIGMAVNLWLFFADRFGKQFGLWPTTEEISEAWWVFISVSTTFVIGYLLGFLPQQRKSDEELRGLVYGHGKPGIRSVRKRQIGGG
jgi:Na+/proline symporter